MGGLALLQMFNVLKQFDLSSLDPGSARSLHLLAEVMKRVNANRRQGIGDTDFVSVPIEGILSEELAKEIAASIDLGKASSVSVINPIDANPYESRETTHYSVMDDFGNAVSTSYTLGYSFGSGLVVPGTGILLDNQMRNFSHRELGHANEMTPGKRPVSTMTPTLVFDVNDEIKIVTGTPGGSRINIKYQSWGHSGDWPLPWRHFISMPKLSMRKIAHLIIKQNTCTWYNEARTK
jgi:gamma-glutamyltranspeptidase/glutathione hydrolase